VDVGRLMRVLTKPCPPLPGYQLYYPSRRHVPRALAALRKRASPPSNVARVQAASLLSNSGHRGDPPLRMRVGGSAAKESGAASSHSAGYVDIRAKYVRIHPRYVRRPSA
jgi:hypothetical protein